MKHEVKITDSVRIKDSVVVTFKTKRKDSVVIKDSIIGIKKGNAGFTIPFNSTTDTIIKKGAITIRRTVNNGVEHIDCDTDSLTILVSDLRYEYHKQQEENERVTSELQEYKKSHSEVVVKEQQKSWLGRLWDNFKNILAWLGLAFLVYLIYKIIRFFK